MKLKIFVLFTIIIFFASCSLNDVLYDRVLASSKENPFLNNVYTILESDATDKLEFALVTDVHLQREEHVSGIKRYDDNFESFLSEKEGGYTALLSLGDLVDEQYPINDKVSSFISRFSKYCSNLFIATVGNHDLHIATPTQWENSSPDIPVVTYFAKRMGVVKCGEVSIYITDNAKRIFGHQQLEYLEEALKKDTNKIKIVLAHENVMSGGVIDQSLILYGNADIYERSNFARILEENNVSLVLSGHTHKGNAIYKFNKRTYEMNLCAYHGRDMDIELESKGNWYTISFDTSTKEIVIKNFLASTKAQIAESRFSY